jgi:hypothetical protein
MATLSTDTILDRWLEGLVNGRPFYANGRRLSAVGDILTGSWRGTPTHGAGDLAQYLPAGRRRRRPLLLVTGDVWASPPFQSSVQWLVRMACQRAAREMGADMLLVPFSALESARVDRSTIRALEIRPDRETVTYEPIALDLAELESAHVIRPLELGYSEGMDYLWRLPDGRIIRRRRITGHKRSEGYGADRRTWTESADELTGATCYRNARATWGDDVTLDPDTGAWRIVHRRHWLGDSVFTADVTGTARRRRPWTVGDVVAAARDAIGAESADVYRETHSYGARHADTLERRLAADSVRPAGARIADIDLAAPIVETRAARRRRRFVSSFDVNEPRPLYYLATLPSSSRAQTVEMAEQDLAPAPVHAAMARGRDVRRQGDIFLVETDLSDTAVYAAAERRARLTQLTRGAATRQGEVGAWRPISARRWRLMRAETRKRWLADTAAVLANGPRPSTAPGGRRTAHVERVQRIADLADYRARARRAVFHGDRWLAERNRRFSEETARELERPSARVRQRDAYRGDGLAAVERRGRASDAAWQLHSGRTGDSRALLRETLAVYQTAHSATEVAIVDGRPYVKGIVRHVPELIGERWRRPEHVPLKLPAGRWYLAIRNTVPRQGDTNGA